MKAFDYAAPRTEGEVLDLLSLERGSAELLAGGTDLIGLMKRMVVTPDFVVNIKDVRSMQGVQRDSLEVAIGAVTTLDEMLDSPHLEDFPALKQAIAGISSQQLQAQGTLGGELLQRPQCWYFRSGAGLLAERGQRAADGDNRFHAILGNQGPARFVSPSRLAPALIALGAEVRVIGPKSDDARRLPLAELYRTPRDESQRETTLTAGQVVTHIFVPRTEGLTSGAYEVRHGEGPDYPLTAAAATLRIEGDVVQDARVVLGHVAPTPWISSEARRALVGFPISQASAEAAADEAVRGATPLSGNQYKVQLARVAVKRAVLRAAGFETGGF